jgi:hypothetical protein
VRSALTETVGVTAVRNVFFSPGAIVIICGIAPSSGTSLPRETVMVRVSGS